MTPINADEAMKENDQEAVESLVVPAAEDEPWDAIALDPETPHEHPIEVVTPIEPVASVPDLLASFTTLGARIDRRIDGLQTLLERDARAEATREKVVDRLHAELQEYKQDLLLNTLRPVFIDLIQLHDDFGKVAAVPEGDEAVDL